MSLKLAFNPMVIDPKNGAMKSAMLGGLSLPRSLDVPAPLAFGQDNANPSDPTLLPFLTSLRIIMASDEEIYFSEPDSAESFSHEMRPDTELRVWKWLNKNVNSDGPLKRLILDRLQELCIRRNPQKKIGTSGEIVDDDKINQLLEWGRNNGVVPRDVQLKIANFDEHGRGVFSADHLERDTSIFQLPYHLIINIETAMKSEHGQLFQELSSEGTHEDMILLLFILLEKNKGRDSTWFHYFETLPQDPNIALVYNLSDLMSLDGLPLMMEILDAKEALRQYHESLFPSLSEKYPKLFPANSFQYEDLLWARAIFDSRGFSIDFGEGRLLNCLLPVVDMLNTSNSPQLEGNPSRDDDKIFRVSTVCQTEKGTELSVSYGPYSGRELLLNYGFVPTVVGGNEYDRMRIHFAVPLDDDAERKINQLTHRGISLDHILRRGKLSPSLMGALRVCVADSSELDLLESEDAPNPVSRPLNPLNEERALCQLQMTLDEIEAELGLEDDEDEDDDETPMEDHNTMMCKRQTQKEILASARAEMDSLMHSFCGTNEA
ncbi:hypothetical protein PROFUN_03948 [Planoprotostelium fungivorum]|uniref:SET domain-containing protein n=1 Tax=Planoprotostelium fungivorum TaxID=1890364 RepID=A0A2P6MTS9_9EUKA|nr:hypothetical protein PROFUN_03948 [Planoprotostelium fungivorum]